MKENNKYSEKVLDVKASLQDDDDLDGDFKMPNKGSKSKTPVLDTYSKDLTKMAEEGKIDPIVGREKEIERVSQILSRRKKNNPILIGEPGCVDGETIIEIRKVSDLGKHNIILK
jgi:ATP-dependent Clp protease ATP-binding subunit ClpC